MELTQAYLKSVLHYDPETGYFSWAANRGRARAGNIAKRVNTDGYRQIRVAGKDYRSHRLAFMWMTGHLPSDQVDHINGDTLDNRWANLRPVTKAENAKNKKRQKNNTSGVTGVFRESGKSKWTAKIIVNRKHIKLGNYDDFNQAVSVRRAAEQHYGFHQNHGRPI